MHAHNDAFLMDGWWGAERAHTRPRPRSRRRSAPSEHEAARLAGRRVDERIGRVLSAGVVPARLERLARVRVRVRVRAWVRVRVRGRVSRKTPSLTWLG